MEAVDRCTFFHASVGALLGYAFAVAVGYYSVLINAGIAVLWEVVEQTFLYLNLWNALPDSYTELLAGDTKQTTAYNGDTWVQAVSDIAVHTAASTIVVAVYEEASPDAGMVAGVALGVAFMCIYFALALTGRCKVTNFRRRRCCIV